MKTIFQLVPPLVAAARSCSEGRPVGESAGESALMDIDILFTVVPPNLLFGKII